MRGRKHSIVWDALSKRSPDAALVLAQIEIVRALRRAGLSHALRGQPCVVGFLVDPEDGGVFAEAARDIFKAPYNRRRDTAYEVVHWEAENASGATRKTDASLRHVLSANSRVFGFAAKIDDMPLLFRQAADGLAQTNPVDTRALQAVFRAVTGSTPSSDAIAAAVGAPLQLLGIAARRGRSPDSAVRMLKKLTATRSETAKSPRVSEGPTLADLHGMGEASKWGRHLAIDLDDYRAGRIPWTDVDRGALLAGPSGTGKTTFARALARTCKVPIHVHSLFQWQAQGHLGDLLKALRSAFNDARQNAPCIMFLDELDAFGMRNGTSDQYEQYTRQVINGLLECLDGVQGREGVVVLGATNLPSKIDPAILRPGRLDKIIVVPLPDAPAREGILRYHLGGVLVQDELSHVAARLEGASGAVIEQQVRDARRRARTERRPMSVDDLIVGLPHRMPLSDRSYHRSCVHEAGHALVGYLLRDETGNIPIVVSALREIAPDGMGGKTTFRPTPGFDRTKSSYLAEITTLLAGLAAEKVVIGEIGDGGGGADNSDLHQATVLAAAMEVSFGLGESLIYLSPSRAADMLTWLRIDPGLRQRVDACLATAMQRAVDLIGAHREALDAITADLIKSESLSGTAIAERLPPPQAPSSSPINIGAAQ